MAELLEANEMFFTSWEPKYGNRFIAYIDGIPSYLIKAIKRPTVELGSTTIDHININRKVKAGKTNWSDISMTIYDAIVPSGAQTIMEWVRLASESVSGRAGYLDFYKKDVTINVLGPVGDKVEEWTLKGAFPTSVDFGQLDFSSSEPLNISVTLAVDYCILQY